jgi:4-amino-4-deoxy-L-arabinose transferase-like glycosyltransferase
MNSSCYAPTLNDLGFRSRAVDACDRVASACVGFGATTSALLITAFASNTTTSADEAANNVVSGISTGLGSLYKVMTAVAIPIAAIVAAFCAFYILAGGDKGMEKAKKIGLYTAIALAIVYLAPLLVTMVQGWFETAGDSATEAVFGKAS